MRSDVLRQKNVSALLYFFCARSISVKFYFHLVFQFKPQHNTSNTTDYGTSDLMSVESLGSIVYHLANCCNPRGLKPEESCASIVSADRYKKSPYGSYIHDIFFIDSQSNYPDPDASTASR